MKKPALKGFKQLSSRMKRLVLIAATALLLLSTGTAWALY